MNFKPTIYIQHFKELDINKLVENGIKVLFVDIDNTLTSSTSNSMNDDAKIFINKLKEFGIRPIVVSNNIKKRVYNLASQLNVEDVCSFALKPLPFSCLYLLKKYNIQKNQVAIMGDQIITDIFYSKINGIIGILVDPISDKDNIFGKVTRTVEKILCRLSGFNRGDYYDKM